MTIELSTYTTRLAILVLQLRCTYRRLVADTIGVAAVATRDGVVILANQSPH